MASCRRLALCIAAAAAVQPAAATVADLTLKPPVNVTMGLAVAKLEEKIRTLKGSYAEARAKGDAKNARYANCAFSLMQAVNFLARSAFQIRVIAKSCPEAESGQVGFKTPMKTCLISTASLVTSMSQIAAGVALAIHTCQDTLKIEALCAAPIAALFTPTSQFIAASTVASAACAKEASQLPKDIDFDRRLAEARRLPVSAPGWAIEPEDRKWQIGECVIDATSAAMAIGQMAIGFNAATKSCPVVYYPKPLQYEVGRAACTLDTAFTFFSFSRLVLFLALAVEHCAPGNQADSLCVAACASLVTSAFAVTFQGSAIYLNCQIGKEKGAILAGTSTMLGNQPDSLPPGVTTPPPRRLEREELLETLHKSAGFDRRLSKTEMIEELAKESEFETVEDLFMSMGYNFSDPDAEWKKDDPEYTELIRKGQQMMQDLQTTRDEPSAEFSKYGPEEVQPSDVPEMLIDPEDEAATLKCSEKGVAYSLDLPGHAVSLEQGAAACQARCAKTPGCVRFSYWSPDRHCRLHGLLAEPIKGQPLWVSGPPGCQEGQISKVTLRTMKRKEHCYHPHAVYEPRDKLAAPRQAASIEDCQRRCQQIAGCAHFIFSEQDGLCSFADSSAVKLQPVMHSVAGPRHCADAAEAFAGVAEKFEVPAGFPVAGGVGPFAQVAAAAFGATAGAAAVFWAALAVSRRVYRRISEGEAPTLE